MRPIEYVRVRDKDSGHEKSIPAVKFNPEVWTLVDKPAVGSDGRPLRDKPRILSKKKPVEATTTAPGQKAEPEKENS